MTEEQIALQIGKQAMRMMADIIRVTGDDAGFAIQNMTVEFKN